MENLLPVLPVLVLFGLAFVARKRLRDRFGMVLASVVLAFFIIMAFADSGHKYHHALFAVLAAAFLIRNVRAAA